MHALETMFSFCPCNSESFQIPSKCIYIVFIFFFDLILLWKVCITLKGYVFFFSSAIATKHKIVSFKICLKTVPKCSSDDVGYYFWGGMSPNPSKPMVPTHWFIPSYAPDTTHRHTDVFLWKTWLCKHWSDTLFQEFQKHTDNITSTCFSSCSNLII